MAAETYEERAERCVGEAIAFLDEHAPEGWRSRVNVEEINMLSRRQCVLGQIYEGQQPAATHGAYGWAITHLREVSDEGYNEVSDAFANYDEEWKRQLQEGA